jgi:hypothetical protein
MSERRIVRLLDAKPLNYKQRAQKKYRASAKGKAAMKRYRDKRALDVAFKASEVERVRLWEQANPTRRRVYKRVWALMQRRRARAASVSA